MKQTILLVEDDKKITMALKLRLQAMGYQVESAPDAVFAMKAAVHSQPDVILLDINLPGGNGFVVADRLRSTSNLGTTPIIFITASKDPEKRKRAASYSESAYLEKPFKASQLVNAIDRLSHGQVMH